MKFSPYTKKNTLSFTWSSKGVGRMDYLLSISLQDLDKVVYLRKRLSLLVGYLRDLSMYCWIEEFTSKDRQIFLWQSVNRDRTTLKEIRLELSRVLAAFISEIEEPELVRKIIQQKFQFAYTPEVKQIEQYAQKIIKKRQQSNWKNTDQLTKQIASFLKVERNFAIDGYARFRLEGRKKVLAQCIQEAIESYLLDKEYKEFIQLLKYFVSVQSSKISLVHVIHQGKKQFHLLKADGKPLRLKEIDGVCEEMMDHTVSHEDYIVSTLLSIAPERVVLHTKLPEENVIRTLLQIFEGRIIVCDGCNECGISLNFPGDA
ncbi:hypothetical protein DL897_01810 [Thermoflavimicrobium daqui]|uniref:Sporulation protein YtxC n=2 Tax=Thermoflavimicrobium daqui TaxID=2137476 RepID=A0A364K949_9BACL|nr:hypothetical protein DL897_01810 [Thermoflavimicrobium daqui]